jgi:sortase A
MLSIKFKRKSIAYYATSLCLILSLVSFAQGGYLLLKANLAQHLLDKAWQETVDSDSKKKGNIKPWPWADIYPVAKLRFDRFDIAQIVLNIDSGQALAFGPGLTFGNTNAFVISAHNDTHFSILSELKLNDNVTLTLKSGQTQIFNVQNIVIMDTKSEKLTLDVTDEEYEHRAENKPMIKELVLVTCYPFGGISDETTLRYVVHLG